MVKVIVVVAGIGIVLLLAKVLQIVIEDIKEDPVANLAIPAVTAFLTNVLLSLLEMRR